MRTIGILGGMGPEATLALQQRVLRAARALCDEDHIPLLIDMNPQVPSRIAHLIEGTGEDPGPTLAIMARRLEGAGAAALAMPCNTAHRYREAITAATAIPFLDMVELAARQVATEAPEGPIGILASPAVRSTGLYERAFAPHARETAWPDDEAALLRAIKTLKRNGPCDEARALLAPLSEQLARAGATTQLIACSELSMMPDAMAGAVRLFDSVAALTDAIVRFSRDSDAP